MRTIKTVLVLLLMCGVALGAGVVAGKLTSRTAAASTPPISPGAGLSDELALTPQQRDQMKEIWEGVRDTAETCTRQAQTAQKQMQSELIGMLTHEQKARYEKIAAATKSKVDSLDAYRRNAFKDAVSRTMRILNPQQRQAYEQIVKNRIGQFPAEAGAPAPPATQSDIVH